MTEKADNPLIREKTAKPQYESGGDHLPYESAPAKIWVPLGSDSYARSDSYCGLIATMDLCATTQVQASNISARESGYIHYFGLD
jgi:hypothetical protein